MDGTAAIALIMIIIFTSFGKAPSGGTRSGQQAHKYDKGSSYKYSVNRQQVNYSYLEDNRMQAIIRQYNDTIPQSQVDDIKRAVLRYGEQENIDPKFVLALMARESRFDPKAQSPTGAMGLGQILPMNFESLGISDATDIDQNTRATVIYIRMKLDEWTGYDDQVGLALASYLEGSGAVKRAGAVYSGHTEIYVNDILRIRDSI